MSSQRASAREVAACALAMALLAGLMCARHISRGGFYYDDWSLLALARFPAPGGVLHGLWLDYGQRPGQVLYYAALGQALGAHAPARLALAAGMLALQASCLYLLLRRVGLELRHAGAICALSLLFPFSDSVWLWGVLSLASLAISCALLGAVLALRAFESPPRRAAALHIASLALYVASVASYEVLAVACCLSGLLYARVVGLRRARWRWALDVAAIAATLALTRIALPIDVATPSRVQGLIGMLSHAALIAAGAARLVGAAVLPIAGVSPWVGSALVAVLLAIAAAVRRRLPAHDALRAELGRWLALAGVGALTALATWAVYVPASDHYLPSTSGTVNRMNAAAAIAIAILIYSCLALLALLATRLARPTARGAGVALLAAALALGVAYLARTAADARAWDAAAADQRRLLAGLHALLPRPPAGATVFALGAPLSVGPGIPVLNTTLDLTSAMRLSYASPRLTGVPLAAGGALRCAASGPRADGLAGAWGDSYLLDVATRRVVRLGGPAQCLASLKA